MTGALRRRWSRARPARRGTRAPGSWTRAAWGRLPKLAPVRIKDAGWRRRIAAACGRRVRPAAHVLVQPAVGDQPVDASPFVLHLPHHLAEPPVELLGEGPVVAG